MDLIGVRAGALCAVAALGVGLSGCGDDTAGSGTSTTATIAPTSYVTREPVTTTTAGPTTTLEPDDKAAAEQIYTVEAGDFFARIAEEYGISVEELVNYNEFPDGVNHVLIPGETIKIPPGAAVPGGNKGVTTDPPTDPTDPEPQQTDPQQTDPPQTDPPQSDQTDPPPRTTAPPDNCSTGSYTIQEGDTSRLAVAQKFDVSVEAMDAANQGTDGYSAFYVGLEIIIPAGSDCSEQ